MTFLIAAAGTGGHVFPGLSVGEALVALGVPRDDVLFVGGDRLEASVYPEEGFPFLQVEVRGLQRSLTLENLTLPVVVARARSRVRRAITERGVRVVLGMGGYVTIPAALAARAEGVVFMHAEQNAEAGLANRLAARWALHSFGAFSETRGLPGAEWVGNPLRRPFWAYDRAGLASEGRRRYDLQSEMPVLGVFGGSLGAGAINDAVATMVGTWAGPPIQVVHLTGQRDYQRLALDRASGDVAWKRVAFEDAMEVFYAVCDLVIARAGGAVAELTATGTPSILIPGQFGSGGHQAGNATALSHAGAAVVLPESELDRIGDTVAEVLFDERRLEEMRAGALSISRPLAAQTIASRMIEVAR